MSANNRDFTSDMVGFRAWDAHSASGMMRKILSNVENMFSMLCLTPIDSIQQELVAVQDAHELSHYLCRLGPRRSKGISTFLNVAIFFKEKWHLLLSLRGSLASEIQERLKKVDPFLTLSDILLCLTICLTLFHCYLGGRCW